ncbi:MAG: hypothetical protein WBW33_34265, partial [Bryobacteraceae bacterium]
KFLWQQHEANRKFVFERPLIIVVGTLAAALGPSEQGSLGLLPIPFLSILAFNLWFTFNRMESSARIVSYLSLVHEGTSPTLPWVGWENALREYRLWLYRVRSGGEPQPSKTGIDQFDSMRFYAPIYAFHLILGVIVTAILLTQSLALQSVLAGRYNLWGALSVWASVVSLAAYCLLFVRFRPMKIRHKIELNRRIWLLVFRSALPNEQPL